MKTLAVIAIMILSVYTGYLEVKGEIDVVPFLAEQHR